jgi:hypothetical protein
MDATVLYNRYQLVSLLLALSLDLGVAVEDYRISPSWVSLVGTHTILYDLITNSLQKKRHVYVVQIRRTLDKILNKSRRNNLLVLDTILKCANYECKDQPRTSLIIGPCVDATLRLQPDGKAIEAYIEPILKLIVQSMISSKQPVQTCYLTPLASYYKRYITPEIYEAKKLQNFDKWMLRSPEVVIHIMNEITKHITFDVGDYFSGKFCSIIHLT